MIADWITAVTASGWETRVRCEPPSKVVTCERARSAIAFSEVGVMIWSPLLMKYHDGIDFHAACVAGVSNAAVEATRCVEDPPGQRQDDERGQEVHRLLGRERLRRPDRWLEGRRDQQEDGQRDGVDQ